jgi:TolB protein
MKKAYGLIVLIILVCGLFGGLAVRPTDASIIFTEQQITSNTASQENPDIYEYGSRNYTIVWQDNRNGNWDIYMYNPWQPGEIRVTNSSGNQINPKIYGDTIVYQDDRNGNWDIYSYNLASKVETQITNDSASQENPAISGNTIVWQDNRNGHWGIYMYNLTTQTEQLVYIDNWATYNDYSPAISGNRIVWIEAYLQSDSQNYWLMCRDLSTGGTSIIEAHSNYTPPAHYEGNLAIPAIYGSSVAWMVENTHNYGVIGDPWQIGMKDLVSGKTVNIGNNVRDGYPDIYGSYIVFERDTVLANSKIANSNIYLYNIDTGVESGVTNDNSTHSRPAISANYGNYVVYMDNRNGNWDIYLNAFGYGVGSTGGGLSPTSSPSNAVVINLGNQGLMTIIISAAIIVVIAVAGAIAFLAMKQRNSKKSNSKSTSK